MPKTLLGVLFFRGGEGGVNWIVYVAVLGSVFILYICYSCIITRCLCCLSENQQAEVDTELKNVRNEKCFDEQLDQYMLELIVLAEQAKPVAYLRTKQIGEQSTAGVQNRPWEQMGYPQLNLDTDSPTTLNDTNITEETPMTSDVQREETDGIPSVKIRHR